MSGFVCSCRLVTCRLTLQYASYCRSLGLKLPRWAWRFCKGHVGLSLAEPSHSNLTSYPFCVRFEMAETKPPPSYDDAATQHGVLPSRSAVAGKPLLKGPLLLDIPVLNILRGKRVILASASPRRKQILSMVYIF